MYFNSPPTNQIQIHPIRFSIKWPASMNCLILWIVFLWSHKFNEHTINLEYRLLLSTLIHPSVHFIHHINLDLLYKFIFHWRRCQLETGIRSGHSPIGLTMMKNVVGAGSGHMVQACILLGSGFIWILDYHFWSSGQLSRVRVGVGQKMGKIVRP